VVAATVDAAMEEEAGIIAELAIIAELDIAATVLVERTVAVAVDVDDGATTAADVVAAAAADEVAGAAAAAPVCLTVAQMAIPTDVAAVVDVSFPGLSKLNKRKSSLTGKVSHVCACTQEARA
jgi:hypothetical protein